jgi:hypothetical protein
MERALIVGLAVGVVAIGSTAAVLRPGVVQVGGPQAPVLPQGVVVESWRGGGGGSGGASVGRRRGRDLSRFQGRGPSGSK